MSATAAIPHAAGELAVVVGGARLEALADDWWDLWRADPRATPFQSPAWLLPWARHYAPDRTGAIVLRRAGALDALLPYFRWRGTLLLAGTGPSDYGDLLATAAARTPAAAQALLDVLAEIATRHGCADVDLQQLRPCSPLLAAAAPAGWRDGVEPGTPCPVVPLCAEGLQAALSGHRRRNLRHALRQLQDAGAVAGRLDAAEVPVAAAELARLHRLRWSERGEPGVVDERLHRFLHEAIPALHAADLLRFQRVRHGGGFVAAVFAMRDAHAVHCYLSGFDPAWSRTSPGFVAATGVLDAAAREGLAEFHLLRGREAYKYAFGAQDRPTFRRRLARARVAQADAP